MKDKSIYARTGYNQIVMSEGIWWFAWTINTVEIGYSRFNYSLSGNKPSNKPRTYFKLR